MDVYGVRIYTYISAERFFTEQFDQTAPLREFCSSGYPLRDNTRLFPEVDIRSAPQHTNKIRSAP